MKTPVQIELSIAVLSLAMTATASAGPRSSADQVYRIATDTIDAGGTRATAVSAGYTNDGSMGSIGGIATVATPAESARSGFIAQLYDPTGLTLSAGDTTVEETTTRQLAALQSLDDGTFLALPANSVAWSVQSGPLTGIDAGGLATAGLVYQDTAATVEGTLGGFTGSLGLTVIDSIPDNFGSYAADGIGDDWQFQYFGLDNPDATPGLDPDGDAQDNRFEFIAGLIPTDPLSRFLLRIEPDPVEAGHQHLIFSPIVAGRTYSVEQSDSLAPASWSELTDSIQGDTGGERTVTDTNATGPHKFYHVNIVKP